MNCGIRLKGLKTNAKGHNYHIQLGKTKPVEENSVENFLKKLCQLMQLNGDLQVSGDCKVCNCIIVDHFRISLERPCLNPKRPLSV